MRKGNGSQERQTIAKWIRIINWIFEKGHLPSSTSPNSLEVNYYGWLSLRQKIKAEGEIRYGKEKYLNNGYKGDRTYFYIEYDQIADQYGLTGIFDRLLTNRDIERIITFRKENNLPLSVVTEPTDLLKEKTNIETVKQNILYEISDNKNKMPFPDYKELVQTLKIRNIKQLKDFCKSGFAPENMYSNPHEIYKNEGFIDYENLFGIKNGYWSYLEARQYIHRKDFENYEELEEFLKSDKKPKQLPPNPEEYYKDNGWVNKEDFIGKYIKISISERINLSENEKDQIKKSTMRFNWLIKIIYNKLIEEEQMEKIQK